MHSQHLSWGSVREWPAGKTDLILRLQCKNLDLPVIPKPFKVNNKKRSAKCTGQ